MEYEQISEFTVSWHRLHMFNYQEPQHYCLNLILLGAPPPPESPSLPSWKPPEPVLGGGGQARPQHFNVCRVWVKSTRGDPHAVCLNI